MKKTLAIAGALLALASTSITGAFAHSGHHAAKKMATKYQCAKCHMKFTAAQAKKDHMKDPMDGGKLVPMKSSMSHSGSMKMKSGSMGGMKM